MRLDERALLQEHVRTLVLRHALEAAPDRLAGAARAVGRDAETELLSPESTLLPAARGVADRAAVQKLAVLAAAEDAAGRIRAAFDGAYDRLGWAPAEPLPDEEPEAAAALALVA